MLREVKQFRCGFEVSKLMSAILSDDFVLVSNDTPGIVAVNSTTTFCAPRWPILRRRVRSHSVLLGVYVAGETRTRSR